MFLLGLEDVFQQLAAAVVADLFAIGDGGAQVLQAHLFQAQVAFEHFLGVLADQQLAEVLQVGQAFEKQDALDQLVGMLHLVDGFIVLMLAELVQAPVLVHPRVQEVLVDGHQFVAKDLVEVLDDLSIAFHDAPPERKCVLASLAAVSPGVKPKP